MPPAKPPAQPNDDAGPVSAVRPDAEAAARRPEEMRAQPDPRRRSDEELETAGHELQTVNADLTQTLGELSRDHDDLQDLMASLDVGVLLLDPALRIVRFTPRIADLFDVTGADEGRPLTDLAHRLDAARLDADARAVLDDLAPIDRELRDLAGRHYLLQVRPYRTTDDRAGGVVLTFIDVTSLKATEEALRTSEARFRHLADVLPPLVWTTATDGTPTYFNERWLAYTGQSEDRARETGAVRDVIHPDDLEGATEAWRRAVGAGSGFEYDYRLRRHDDVYEWHLARAMPVHGPDGEIVEWVGSALNVHAQRLAEEALRTSEEQYRILVENAREYAILFTDPAGEIGVWSTGAERMFGYREDEVLGRSADLIFTEADRAAHVPDQERAEAAETGVANDERWHMRRGGSLFWAHGVLTAVCDDAGAVRGFVKVLRDNTHRKQAEDALRESEARFRALAAAVPDIVWVLEQTEAETAVTFQNDRWVAYTGLPAGAPLADQVRAVHPDDLPALRRAWAQARRAAAAFVGEGRLRRADGEHEWHLIRAEPVATDDDAVRWYATATNVHASKTAEAALVEAGAALAEANRTLEERVAERTSELEQAAAQLRATKRRFRLLFETAPIGIGLVLADGRLDAANPALQNILGYEEAEALTGRSWMDLTHPDDLAACLVLHQELVEGRQDGYEIEARCLRRDGDAVWTQQTVRAVRDDAGALSYTVTTVQDVTERHRLEMAALRAADAERHRLSAEVHDDLGQRLAGAAVMASTFARRLMAEEHDLASKAERLGSIIRDAVRQARAISHGLAPLDLPDEGLSGALQRLGASTEDAYGLPCQFRSDARDVTCPPAVATHLYRIAQEAVSNAARHARATSIQILLSVDEGQIDLRVRDDGIGLANTTLASGGGLGLHTMKARASALGGTLSANPVHPHGTEIVVRVPQEAEPAPGGA